MSELGLRLGLKSQYLNSDNIWCCRTGDELHFGISAMRYLNSQDIYIQGRV